jgi:hypothetical protein
VSEDYIPFEKALKDLKMTEEELKRLVSEDEIQAHRGADGSVQLRKEDIDALLSGEEDFAEELVFADEDLEEDTGMVTAVLEDDSLLEEEPTLDLSPEEIEVDEDFEIEAAPSRGERPIAIQSKSRAAAIRGLDQSEGQEEEESTLDKVLMIGSAIVLVYGLFFAWSVTQGQKSGATEWLANMFK